MSFLKDLSAKRAKFDKRSAETAPSPSSRHPENPFLKRPCNIEETLFTFLQQARHEGRKLTTQNQYKITPQNPVFEIEGRIGMLTHPYYGDSGSRVTSSGTKKVIGPNGKAGIFHGFLCNTTDGLPRVPFQGGITKSHFIHWTGSGLSEHSPVSASLGLAASSPPRDIKAKIEEVDYVENVYSYEGKRICYVNGSKTGRAEKKERQSVIDIALPSAEYDMRISLNTETALEDAVPFPPPSGYSSKRMKRRRRYTRRDKSFAWQLDVTEVGSSSTGADEVPEITYEIEVELLPHSTYRLITSADKDVVSLCKQLASQLWWMLNQINPTSEILDVESFLKDHTDTNAVKLAQQQCAELKHFKDTQEWTPAITANGKTNGDTKMRSCKFIGCMPVNFSRHNIEQVQRCGDDGYYLSEKTDGVRYLLIFTPTSAVFIDRAMKGKMFTLGNEAADSSNDTIQSLTKLIQPGTVLDGELVMHRKHRRPIFIVFDVMCIGERPIFQQPFKERLLHLRQGSFRHSNVDIKLLYKSDYSVHVLPLVIKNFVSRLKLDTLLSYVVEEKGKRVYKNGEQHCHCTDGIIFQPNAPYVLGTDTKLLKWKYLDTVTIDVELLPPLPHKDDDWRVGVLGDENSMVDMTRYIHLPSTMRMRLEADRLETKAKIAEVGFDPETGEWYYVCMRPDKIASNHISTVLGTLLELAESLSTNELRYRMNVKCSEGGIVRDMYRKEIKGMEKQMLDFQRKKNSS